MFKFIKRLFIPDCISIANGLSEFDSDNCNGICGTIFRSTNIVALTAVSDFIRINFPEWACTSVQYGSVYPIADPSGELSGSAIYSFNVGCISQLLPIDNNIREYRTRRQMIIFEMIQQLKKDQFKIVGSRLIYTPS